MAKRVDKQVNLFYCAECEELAKKVADHSDAIQLRTISWRCPSQHTPRATYPTAVEDDSSKETDRIPTPKVIIDQDSNPDATIVEVAFGDRLGALLDTVRVLCEKAKEVLMEESNVQANCSICSKLTKILDKIQLLTRLFCALLFYL
ncbi:uncharacterized protein LOC121980496 isoform X1 [Zingiber officinale]|uniref:uncharacterized protein LOC121980496 isoform X1 n=1 Tax=Zingiber officinale TaxID=94328 RepID=UPI001C4BFEDC|nr:uncharacterized protein LOC121980496 isoform X1 [Zingiber officinale]